MSALAERHSLARAIKREQRRISANRDRFAVLFRLLGNWPSLAGLTLGPEERECIRFYNGVRAAALEDRLHAQVVHVPLEGRRSRAVGAKNRAMGSVTGAPDYVVTWSKGSAWIEIKVNRNGLTSSQVDYRTWCRLTGTPHYVCRSAEEAWLALVELGVLDEGAVG